MDRIEIKNLEIFGHHGVYSEENTLGQKFLVDVTLFVDTKKAGFTDDLSYSVSYGDIIRLIQKEMTKQVDKLLEKVAERLAQAILLKFSLINSLELSVKKPWAPVMAHIDYASVTIIRGWHKVYIGAGSNIGDRQAWIRLAGKRLDEMEWNRKFRSASVIETEPYGYQDQDKFLNTVFEFETLLTPEELLEALHGIEKEAGRTREIHWGPRTLDLDILLYDNIVIDNPDLIIPHPEMEKRSFVLTPLCELNPYGVHPIIGKRFCDITPRN